MELAIIRSVEGDHAGSLQAFRSLWPVVRVAARQHPQLFAAYHNALAVELSELGHRDEARAAISVALASPIAHAYPEFQATAAEIAQAQPQRIAVVVIELPQEEGETITASALVTATSEPPRRFSPISLSIARTLLNPRAPTRAPPSLF